MKRSNYYVVIVNDKTKKVEKFMGPFPFGKADKVCGGVSINLDHANYSAMVTSKKPRTPRNGRA